MFDLEKAQQVDDRDVTVEIVSPNTDYKTSRFSNSSLDKILPLQHGQRQVKHEEETLGIPISLRADLNRAGATFSTGYLGVGATIAVVPSDHPQQVIADSGLAMGLGGVQLLAIGLFALRAHRAWQEGRKSSAYSIWFNMATYLLGGVSSIGMFK